MLFAIRKASWYGAADKEEENNPPCEKAEFSSIAVPESTHPTGMKIRAYVDTKWVINIESLEDLLAIMEETGEDLIIRDGETKVNDYSIIIYDGYVE